jgi:DNA sulfur modification protein DndC
MSKIETIVEVTTSDKFRNATCGLKSEIQEAYLENDAPWIICFSGGKDSTAVLQLVFYALSELPKESLAKEVHVLSNDTLVENPSISKYLDEQLEKIRVYGKEKLYRHNSDLFCVEKGKPEIEDRFWVNLIGRGYPSPNRFFRWCTDRLKINPTSKYIQDSLKKYEKVIIVLGTRKAESANRAASMKNYDNNGHFRNHTLPNVLVYAPIADLSNNDVWAYLLQTPNPWGSDNMDLLAIYGNACSGGECPFVIETGTQSCGKSRFGCWVCTVIDRDRSMENFISNGEHWMEPLLNFRNWLYEIRQGNNQYVPNRIKNKVKFSGFLLKTRREILKRLLNIQNEVKIELIDSGELSRVQEILDEESLAATKEGLKRFVFELSNGERLAVISDYNVAKTSRTRVGSISIQKATLIKCADDVSSKYSKSTRVMYYKCEGKNGGASNG